MMKDFTVYYSFKLPDGSEEGFHLRLDPETLELRGGTPAVSPEWTKLDFHQCPNCPLKVEEHPDCPLALRLVNLVQRFDGLLSHERVDMEVVTEERTITQKTTAQRGISSLMGLVIAASGCPHTAVFRPMARFHLPLASNEETVYRATAMYLLAQYFLKKEGAPSDPGLDGLSRIYENIQIINVAIAERLRAATTTDSSVNAIVVLDVYAKTAELVIGGSLERIRYIFAPYFQNPLTGP
ncbi:MAG TPA: hypothetical protein VF514_04550 [Bacteroidota bacterium]